MAKIAILGFGTVGSGVAEVLTTNAASIEKKLGQPVEVQYILARRDYPESPFAEKIVKDFSVIENDPEITVVAECIGGCGAARDYTLRALGAGKSVVTSNKNVVAAHGDEFLKLAREKNLGYYFEASVGGGIPIIRPLTACLAANEISEVYGILNGTTNYILTKMIREGLSFDTALKEAQEKGYAEADPTADIEGHDACRKICILASLVFGRHVLPEEVPTVGITSVTAADVALAGAFGKKLKLLGRALRQENGTLMAYVSPHLVADGTQIAGVEDVFNGIVVKGNAVGDVMFYGPGAGKLPTASAVAADILSAVKQPGFNPAMGWEPADGGTVGDVGTLPMAWYLRTNAPRDAILAVLPEAKIAESPAAPGEIGVLTPILSRQALEEKRKELPVAQCFPVLA